MPTKLDRIDVLDDGFVRLVDHMGDDAAIVQAARTSYGAGTKKKREDRDLIRYLMRNYHTSPFEMVEFKFHVRVPMDCWRQWIRHRTANVNEYSTRYSEAIDSMQTTAASAWRLQSGTNKQGSTGYLEAWPEDVEIEEKYGRKKIKAGDTEWKWSRHGRKEAPETPGELLTQEESKFHSFARSLYKLRLLFGVAREQARKDLPLCNYTEAYWKIDLHNLFHFLRLRMDEHAQWEIRQYAIAMYTLIEPIVPAAVEAFNDYRLQSMQLSGPEVQCLRSLQTGEAGVFKAMTKREQGEFQAKLERLGIKAQF